jgi:lactate dehydrogenase-like 2-hydroxyacid dehydrogenase
MNIYFIEPEQSDIPFFEEALGEHELFFAENDGDVEPDCEILSVYIHSKIDALFLDRHPHLRFITTRSAGFDRIDVAECAGRGIPVANAAGDDANTVAEHTFALILAVARRLSEVREANKRLGADSLRNRDGRKWRRFAPARPVVRSHRHRYSDSADTALCALRAARFSGRVLARR